VNKIYDGIKLLEEVVAKKLFAGQTFLVPEVKFIHCEDLEHSYPHLTPMQRENEAVKRYGAAFFIGIGHPLPYSKDRHDLRAADYDDWYTMNGSISHHLDCNGGDCQLYKCTRMPCHGLNGDLMVWDPVLNQKLEFSSMGIRVDKEALEQQCRIQGTFEMKKNLPF